MNIYTVLLHIHSVFRYVALLLLVIAVFHSLYGFISSKRIDKAGIRWSLLSLATFHVQVLVGILLYWLSPKVMLNASMFKVNILRFFTIEHGFVMLLAAILITVGYSKAKKSLPDKGYRIIFIYYLIVLVLVLWAIPWPFKQALAAGWM